jgi:GT2 family glycosyltransferase
VTMVVVIVVGYKNAADVADCLRALSALKPEPSFEVFVAENGANEGMKALTKVLDDRAAAWTRADDAVPPTLPENALRLRNYQLVTPDGASGAPVHVAEMAENLGYAGGVNAWLRPLLGVSGWDAAWILNPDTQPEADALAELTASAKTRGKGMIGSCIIRSDQLDTVFTRGLHWSKFAGRSEAIDRGQKIAFEPDPNKIEERLTAPSGASVYVTRDLINVIGLMDERYFLYCEDLEWGERARRLGMVSYAHRSRVPHRCGTTIGGTAALAKRSPLSVYLLARNVVLFVRDKHPAWLAWTLALHTVRLFRYGLVGAFSNMLAGFDGLADGVRGEEGRPDHYLRRHRS